MSAGRTALGEEVMLSPVLPSDLEVVAAGNYQAFSTFYDPIEPVALRPAHDIRVKRFAQRLLPVINSPQTHCVKATIDGKLVGVTIWQKTRKGEKVFNIKRRRWDDETGLGELGEWEGVDRKGDDGVWGVWDDTRARIMGDLPHYYLAPIWIVPEHQRKGIGKLLLLDGIAKADEDESACYLEASVMGSKLYAQYGFEVVGTGEYVEMVRWGKCQKPT